MGGMMDRQIGKGLHSCEKCGYERGFHVSFEGDDGNYQIILICPNCGQRYRVGWTFP